MSVPPPNGWGYRNGSSGPLKRVTIRPWGYPDHYDGPMQVGWRAHRDDDWQPYRPGDEIWTVFARGMVLRRAWWDDDLQRHNESMSWDDFPGFDDGYPLN